MIYQNINFIMPNIIKNRHSRNVEQSGMFFPGITMNYKHFKKCGYELWVKMMRNSLQFQKDIHDNILIIETSRSSE